MVLRKPVIEKIYDDFNEVAMIQISSTVAPIKFSLVPTCIYVGCDQVCVGSLKFDAGPDQVCAGSDQICAGSDQVCAGSNEVFTLVPTRVLCWFATGLCWF